MNIRKHPEYDFACQKVGSAFDPNTPNVKNPLDIREDFYLEILEALGMLASGRTMIDLGAGFSRFSPVAQVLGMNVTIIDDFGGGGGIDPAKVEATKSTLIRLQQITGLKVISQNFIANPTLSIPTESIDVVTCFHCLEHLHHSPKRLFSEIRRILKKGGFAVFATPNAVNLRKRVWVLLGKSNLPKLEQWYNQEPEWRGHVREPILSDLHDLFRWNGFDIHSSYGRNFYARDSLSLRFIPRKLRHALTNTAEHIMRFFPTLCSDIHVIAKKQ